MEPVAFIDHYEAINKRKARMLSIHSKFILKISGLQYNWFDKVKHSKVSHHRGMSSGIQENTHTIKPSRKKFVGNQSSRQKHNLIWTSGTCMQKHKFPRKLGKDGQSASKKHHKLLYCFPGTEIEEFRSVREAFSTKLLICLACQLTTWSSS